MRPAFGLALAAALTAAIACAPPAKPHRRVVVIGIDGFDPNMVIAMIERGVMPNTVAMLQKGGSYLRLETSIPPQSPVAWSNFITGMDPGGHGIFDFIHRDTSTYLPVFSTSRVTEPERTLKIGSWVLPLSAGKTELLRKGETFWQILERRGIPCTVIRVPANFPPAASKARTLSGMGTPDLAGGYGTFSLFTDDTEFEDGPVAGGTIQHVTVAGGQVNTYLVGPANTMRRNRVPLTIPLRVDVSAPDNAARVTIGDASFLLAAGQWSDWTRVAFAPLGPLTRIHGICRFYLESVSPFRLYVTPINLDPVRPALPISTPGSYAREMHDAIGDFYTMGMPEDTKALASGVFDDSAFVRQTDNVLAEEWRMLDAALASYKDGLLFFYVSTVDPSCHMLWRNADRRHPMHAASPGFADRIDSLYAAMDSLIGVVVSRVPKDAAIIVMSDHGFAPLYKKVNLNTWLYREGYLSLVSAERIGQSQLFADVSWRRTRAYALGLNALYLNVMHRESKGVVRRGAEYDSLLTEIEDKLLALRDPDSGEHVVSRVYRPSEVYHGPEVAHAPDLIVGYNRGYRSSDESALGTLSREWLEPNLGRWSGDHCIDHELVPGVLIANRPMVEFQTSPALIDLPVTILGLYGIEKPAQMRGQRLIQ
ncbi:MAG TPA: alkaline phosphatase family protein [Candidatus Eisenbacteria bacterium]|nr:alkaline phosphatase family protein [Candidatus Eisenbacteria bacterium]